MVTAATPALDTRQLLHMYEQMWRIRVFEERAMGLYREGLMRGTTHAYIGMEAVAVGVCAALRDDDYITSTHRGHGHCIAKGGDIPKMFAELLGKATGYCKGKGGSMHIADVDRGILGANGIVGGGMGIATGAALTARLRGRDSVAVCFFGDGALNQGILHEVSNLAAIWRLPVIYCCENNHFAMSARVEQFTSVADPSIRAQSYGMPGVTVDGMDVLAVYETMRAAVARARRGDGPSYVVCDTYRFFGHHIGDPLNYRTREEVEVWRQRDPIARLEGHLIELGVLTEAGAREIEAKIRAELDAAVEFAKQSPEPSADELMEDIYA